MREPQTWQDILNRHQKSDDGHSWKITGSSGKNASVRRLGPRESSAQYSKIIYYKCSKCNAKGKRYPGESIEPELDSHKKLTCDEIMIKDIIE